MRRWLWWAPIILATLLLAALAFRYGRALITLTETDVITRYAAQYLNEAGAGARASDCAAVPSGDAGVWVSLRCKRADGALFVYDVSRTGRLISPPPTIGPKT